jgi:dolichol-phosphate mannosyltransferase
VTTAGFGVGAAVFFVGGLLLLCIGVLGEYLGRVYDEVRSRPLSIINRVYGSPALLAPQVGMIAVQSDNYQNRNATEAA